MFYHVSSDGHAHGASAVFLHGTRRSKAQVLLCMLVFVTGPGKCNVRQSNTDIKVTYIKASVGVWARALVT